MKTHMEKRTIEILSRSGKRQLVHLDDVMFGKPWVSPVDGSGFGGRADRAFLPAHIVAMLPKGPFD